MAENSANPDSTKLFSKSDFKFEKKIAEGLYGPIRLALMKSSNETVVLKAIHKSKVALHDLSVIVLERILHMRLEHDNILKFYGHFGDKFGRYYVLEYVPNGNLFDKMEQVIEETGSAFSNQVASKYVNQVASALHYIHSMGILHGDIKPENVLLDNDNNCKLSDFGLAWPLSWDTIYRGTVGTVEYMAPEIIKENFYDHTIDCWSLGVLCYELLVGNTPFKSKDESETKKKICTLQFTYPEYLTFGARSLIRKLLVEDIKTRLPIGKALMHPWLLMEGLENCDNVKIFKNETSHVGGKK